MQKNGKILFIFGIILLQLLFMGNFYFKHIFYAPMFESDAASDVLLSKLLYDEGKWIYSDNWYYSTEAGLLNKIPFLGVLYHAIGDYQISYGFTRIIMVLFLCVSAAILLRTAGVSLKNILVGALLLMIPYGSYRRYSTFSMLTGIDYYIYFAIFPFLFMAIWLCIRHKRFGKVGTGLLLALEFLLSLIVGIVSIRFSFILIAPVCMTECVELWRKRMKGSADDKSLPARWSILLLGVSCICFAIGSYIQKHVIYEKYSVKDFSSVRFAGIDQIREQFWLVVDGILKAFGYNADGGVIVSTIGVCQLLCLVYPVLVVILTIKLLQTGSGRIRYVTLFFVIQFLTGIFVQLVTSAVDIGAVQRYVWESMFGLIMIPALYLEQLDQENQEQTDEKKLLMRKLVIIFSMAGVLLVNNLCLRFSYRPDSKEVDQYGSEVVKGNYRNATVEQRQGYIQFLKAAGLTFGYGEFWDANITTVLTNDEITVCAVNDDEFLSYKRWSNRIDTEDTDKYPPQFYLYTNGLEQARLERGWGVGNRVLYRDDYFVVYEP